MGVEVQEKTENISLDTIQDGIGTICEIDDAVYDRLRDGFGDDPEVRKILDQIDSSEIWPHCGLDQLYKYLGEEKRKKIGWHEFVCDVNACLDVATPPNGSQ